MGVSVDVVQAQLDIATAQLKKHGGKADTAAAALAAKLTGQNAADANKLATLAQQVAMQALRDAYRKVYPDLDISVSQLGANPKLAVRRK